MCSYGTTQGDRRAALEGRRKVFWISNERLVAFEGVVDLYNVSCPGGGEKGRREKKKKKKEF